MEIYLELSALWYRDRDLDIADLHINVLHCMIKFEMSQKLQGDWCIVTFLTRLAYSQPAFNS